MNGLNLILDSHHNHPNEITVYESHWGDTIKICADGIIKCIFAHDNTAMAQTFTRWRRKYSDNTQKALIMFAREMQHHFDHVVFPLMKKWLQILLWGVLCANVYILKEKLGNIMMYV